ncbi:MAG TPA: methionyl-tRNA formyltransferase [Candidatus Paceibacterota bacterium]
MRDNISFVFFGTGKIARGVLEELLSAGMPPALVVTAPDRKQSRGLTLSPSPVAILATEHEIETLKPEKLDEAFLSQLAPDNYQLFIVADYGAILPQKLLDIPGKGTLNMHPSLLPRLRGPSPIRSAILNDEKKVGVSIMLLDDEMDHGPIVAQKEVVLTAWPPHGTALDEILSHAGGRLLAQILPLWARDEIEAHPQNHDLATYTGKFLKEDGLLDLSADPYQNLLKIRAFEGWPGTFAFFDRDGKRIRAQILDAELEQGRLDVKKVKPEGKKELSYEEFLRSGVRQL